MPTSTRRKRPLYGNPMRIRIVFALDADVDITRDKNIMKLAQYARVEWVKNLGDLLNEKDSPVDQGLEVFQTLYNGRRCLS